MFDSRIVLKDREATNLVRYSLSEHGKVLTVTECFQGPVVRYDKVWVFDKEQ